jgi:predicted GNAT family acetyltransferase
MTNQVRDNEQRRRFELDVDGQVVFATYRRQGEIIAIDHVEAPVQLRGTGAASRLMEGVATIARRDGLVLAPYCGYAAAWLRRHKEHRDLLA